MTVKLKGSLSSQLVVVVFWHNKILCDTIFLIIILIHFRFLVIGEETIGWWDVNDQNFFQSGECARNSQSHGWFSTSKGKFRQESLLRMSQITSINRRKMQWNSFSISWADLRVLRDSSNRPVVTRGFEITRVIAKPFFDSNCRT